MSVIARDAVASDHLVYAWPFPIGPEEHEVACAEDELVVMCPSWMVGDRLGPGRHRWRTPDPMRPVSAYFVLTAPVEVSFDMITQFLLPATGQQVRIRATGSLQVRCMDPALLVAQFVGLPFDSINDGVMRSVSRSVERMLARLLTRRVVMAATPHAVSDPAMLSNIVEELVAYNPTAGAVFGVELVRVGHFTILADDGSRPWQQMGAPARPANGGRRPDASMLETVRGPKPADPNLVETARTTRPPSAPTLPAPTVAPVPAPASAPKIAPVKAAVRAPAQPPKEASGEIVVKPTKERKEKTTSPGHAVAGDVPPPARVITTPVPPPPSVGSAAAASAEPADEDETQPEYEAATQPQPVKPPAVAGAILGIGVSHVGATPPGGTGDGHKKIAPGGRVLVPGPDGLMQSATVRQLLQGYYELEVGGSGETIWVPINGVVPE